jgi:hypothetical protein
MGIAVVDEGRDGNHVRRLPSHGCKEALLLGHKHLSPLVSDLRIGVYYVYAEIATSDESSRNVSGEEGRTGGTSKERTEEVERGTSRSLGRRD